MHKIFIVALILWIVIYIYLVFVSCFKYLQILNCIHILSEYLENCRKLGFPVTSGSNCHDENFRKSLSNVLHIYPNITQILGINTPALNYGYTDLKNYNNSVSIFYSLLKERDFAFFNIKSKLNPFKSLKLLFTLPGKFLEYLGFTINTHISKIFSIVVWLTAYLLEIYSDEIKHLINSFFQ